MARLLRKILEIVGPPFRRFGRRTSQHSTASNVEIRCPTTARDLVSALEAGTITGVQFNRLTGIAVVDRQWLLNALSDAVEAHNWKRVNMLLPFAPQVSGRSLNTYLGKALRGSFDDLVTGSPEAVWGTPELIVDAMERNDPEVISDLEYVCKSPASNTDWFLDYRKPVDMIERTDALPTDERIRILRRLLGTSPIDDYVQEAIERISTRSS